MCLLINQLSMYMQSNDLCVDFPSSLHCSGEAFRGHFHNGEHCKRETGSPRDGLNWDRQSQGCLLKSLSYLFCSHFCFSSCILIAFHKDRTSLECKHCLWWNWWNACGFVSVRENDLTDFCGTARSLSLSDPQNQTDRFCYCSFNALPTHSLGPSSEMKCINISMVFLAQ